MNYYGLLTEYRDVKKRPLPGPQAMSGYRGIITTFNSGKMSKAKEYMRWLKKQLEVGKRVVVLGQLGGTADRSKDRVLKELLDQVFHHMGLGYEADHTRNQAVLGFVRKDKRGVEFERRYPPFPMAYEKFVPLKPGEIAILEENVRKRLGLDDKKELPKNVVDACKKTNSKIIYISTSNVFDCKKKVFLEDDIPNPINHYGFTKLAGEKIVVSSHLPFLILRTDQPYSWVEKWQKESFVMWVLAKLGAGKIIEVFANWYNNPTFLDNFIEVTNELIKREKEGIYHVVGSDYISRYEWALKIAEIFGKNQNLIRPTKSDQSKLPAKRANANLSNSKVQKETEMMLFGVEKGLKLMLKQVK